MRPQSKDTRLLVAGVVAFLALVVYLGVAFANTHATTSVTAPNQVNKLAPFVASNSKLVAVPTREKGRYAVRVTPAGAGYYGALVPTLVVDPQPVTFVVGFWLKGARPGRIGIELDEFRPGRSPKLVNTTVPVPVKWRYFSFAKRVKGQWLGLGLFIYRRSNAASAREWFAVRGLSAKAP